MGIENTKY
jgi:hypothetical protein